MATLSHGWLADGTLSPTTFGVPDRDTRPATLVDADHDRVARPKTQTSSWAQLDPTRTLIITLGASILLHVWLIVTIPSMPAPAAAPAGAGLSVRIGDFALPASPQPTAVDSVYQPKARKPALASEPSQMPPASAEPSVLPTEQSKLVASAVEPVRPPAPTMAPAPTPIPTPTKRPGPTDRTRPAALAKTAHQPVASKTTSSASSMQAAMPERTGSEGPGDSAMSQPLNKTVMRSTETDKPAPMRVTDPVYRSPPEPPVYPSRAVRFGQQGRVMVRAYLSTLGEVLNVEVHDSSGHPLLDTAAIAAVRNWRFEPARRGGRAVLAVVDLPVNFRLQQ